MNRENLIKFLEKSISKKLNHRIPRFIKNYPKRAKVNLLKKEEQNNSLEVISNSFWGEPFHLLLPETVSSAIYTCGYFEEHLTRSFIELLNPNDTFIDIGAHIGYFSKLASTIVGPKGNVYSFEPTKSTYAFLSKNILHNTNIKAINKAVFSENKELTFHDYGPRYSAMNSFTNGRFSDKSNIPFESINVPAIVLDDFILENNLRPNFIKIDAESAEYDILLGMKNTLKNIRPIITIEVGDYGISNIKTSREIVEFVLSHNYNAYEFNTCLTEHKLKDTYSYQNIIFIPQ